MKKWLSVTCGFQVVDQEIMLYEAEGWTFHSFGVNDSGVLLLFWRMER